MARSRIILIGLGSALLSAAVSGCSDDDAGSGGTYSVAEVCEKFASVTCAKAEACGLVLDQTEAELVCVDCTSTALAFIAATCAQDLAGPKDAAAVDRCLDEAATVTCDLACSDADVPGCEVLEELMGGTEQVECDEACASG